MKKHQVHLPPDWDDCPREWQNFITSIEALAFGREIEVVIQDQLTNFYKTTGYLPGYEPCTLTFNDPQMYTLWKLKFS
jgi:hypothetical protein